MTINSFFFLNNFYTFLNSRCSPTNSFVKLRASKPEWRKPRTARPTQVVENEREAKRRSLSFSVHTLVLSSLGVLLREVPLHVQREMIAPGEGTLADRAFKGLSPGVLAVMPRQFVAPGESPLAFRPLTLIRFLAWNSQQEERHKWKRRAQRDACLRKRPYNNYYD